MARKASDTKIKLGDLPELENIPLPEGTAASDAGQEKINPLLTPVIDWLTAEPMRILFALAAVTGFSFWETKRGK